MNVEEIVMKIITHSGNAKSDAVEAIQAAKGKDIAAANELIEKSEAELLHAHHVQTSLIQNEACGNKAEVTLFLVYAQDHLMNAITFKDLAKEFVELYESMNK
ncbi:PTS lactose/cellobiose transporter subunit IIA [Bacillus sporothermodurans]|uniref:PTS lactose/cellobiose transporter subunit IIA n=1 Tax=Heyndrickxia sporothermodurans TaxID=46224 RepID=UPI00192C9875|nr:PTS lactose/cellobiose transporter subunit IIA [Heyndrickxia sporothermodurans]MBL5767676.1 PTS lactose/cellobiose transporter subunit IIA [Heyndrickxia sporothermodurans]MBL5785559.1 PTS lactose/cellobiose transporter subunit IIA [Heyndrickxia sporothermodurans]MBL5908635.1 PTS lactose/cellobiose transporter subunit IIA [Heyndrickxia sporothermodurans]